MRIQSVTASYLVLRKKGEDGQEHVLMGLRHNTGYHDGDWSLPAGHLEMNEPPTVAMAREAKEEIGLELDPARLSLLHVMWRSAEDAQGGRVDFYFEPNDPVPEAGITNMEPDKCARLEWFSIAALPENVIPEVKEALSAIQAGALLHERYRP